jgi:hypothetical protein
MTGDLLGTNGANKRHRTVNDWAYSMESFSGNVLTCYESGTLLSNRSEAELEIFD